MSSITFDPTFGGTGQLTRTMATGDAPPVDAWPGSGSTFFAQYSDANGRVLVHHSPNGAELHAYPLPVIVVEPDPTDPANLGGAIAAGVNEVLPDRTAAGRYFLLVQSTKTVGLDIEEEVRLTRWEPGVGSTDLGVVQFVGAGGVAGIATGFDARTVGHRTRLIVGFGTKSYRVLIEPNAYPVTEEVLPEGMLAAYLGSSAAEAGYLWQEAATGTLRARWTTANGAVEREVASLAGETVVGSVRMGERFVVATDRRLIEMRRDIAEPTTVVHPDGFVPTDIATDGYRVLVLIGTSDLGAAAWVIEETEDNLVHVSPPAASGPWSEIVSTQVNGSLYVRHGDVYPRPFHRYAIRAGRPFFSRWRWRNTEVRNLVAGVRNRRAVEGIQRVRRPPLLRRWRPW